MDAVGFDTKEDTEGFKCKILMGRDNPNGVTLENILLDLTNEVLHKSNLIKDSQHPQRDMILLHNKIIVNMLEGARFIQEDTYSQLDAVAPNKGPKEPRL